MERQTFYFFCLLLVTSCAASLAIFEAVVDYTRIIAGILALVGYITIFSSFYFVTREARGSVAVCPRCQGAGCIRCYESGSVIK